MYKEGYYLHNPSIPYYAYDYRQPHSIVFSFYNNVDYVSFSASNYPVIGIYYKSISDQIGASIHDRVYFSPMCFLESSNVNWSALSIAFLISSTTADQEGEGEDGDGGPPLFDPPLGEEAPKNLCTEDLYYLVSIASIEYV